MLIWTADNCPILVGSTTGFFPTAVVGRAIREIGVDFTPACAQVIDKQVTVIRSRHHVACVGRQHQCISRWRAARVTYGEWPLQSVMFSDVDGYGHVRKLAGSDAEVRCVAPLIQEELFLALGKIHKKDLALRAYSALDIALVRRKCDRRQYGDDCQCNHEFDQCETTACAHWINPPERQGKTVAFISHLQKSRRTRRRHRYSMSGLWIATDGFHLIRAP